MSELEKLYEQLRTEADVKHKMLSLQQLQTKVNSLERQRSMQQIQAESAQFCLAEAEKSPLSDEIEHFGELNEHWKQQIMQEKYAVATLDFIKEEMKITVNKKAPKTFAYVDSNNCNELVITCNNFYVCATKYKQIWQIIDANETHACKLGSVLHIPLHFCVQVLKNAKKFVKLSPLFCNQTLFALALQQKTQSTSYLQTFIEILACVNRFETKLFMHQPPPIYIHDKSMAAESYFQFVTLCELRVVLTCKTPDLHNWYHVIDDHMDPEITNNSEDFFIPIGTIVRVASNGSERTVCVDSWLAFVFQKYYIMFKQKTISHDAYKHLFRTKAHSQP